MKINMQLRRELVLKGVSIVVINFFRNFEYLKKLLISIQKNTLFHPFEVVVEVNKIPSEDTNVQKYQDLLDQYDFLSAIRYTTKVRGFAENCNRAAKLTDSKYLLFLNDDVEVKESWLTGLVNGFNIPEVGIVGNKALYPNGSVQHCGIVFVGKSGNLLTRHAFKGYSSQHYLVDVSRWYQAITGACLLIGRENFEALEGFDECYSLGFEDVDLAFRLRKMFPQLGILYTPHSEIVHHEGITRGTKDENLFESEKRFLQRFEKQIVVDSDEYLRPEYMNVFERENHSI